MRGQVDWDVIKGALATLALMVLLAAVFGYVLIHVPESPSAVRDAPGAAVARWHDPEHAVTCWLYREGIACLPDMAFE